MEAQGKGKANGEGKGKGDNMGKGKYPPASTIVEPQRTPNTNTASMVVDLQPTPGTNTTSSGRCGTRMSGGRVGSRRTILGGSRAAQALGTAAEKHPRLRRWHMHWAVCRACFGGSHIRPSQA